MNFSTDRDLLRMEPSLFNDVPVLATQRLKVGDAAISGTTLTSNAANFVNADVDAGAVVLVRGVPLEVITRTDSHHLTVSRLRTRAADAAVPPESGTGRELIVRTFAPQAALVSLALLRMVGIDADVVSLPGQPAPVLSTDSVISLSAMSELEVLGTLAQVFAAAVALSGDSDAVRDKAEHYRRRFEARCRSAVVYLDTDGDGLADTVRRPGVIQLHRV